VVSAAGKEKKTGIAFNTGEKLQNRPARPRNLGGKGEVVEAVKTSMCNELEGDKGTAN